MILKLTKSEKKLITILIKMVIIFFLSISKISFANTEEPQKIIVVYNKNLKIHSEIIESFKNNTQNRNITTVSIQEFIDNINGREKQDSISLVIGVGTNITAKIIETNTSSPILSIAIPKLSYQKLKKKHLKLKTKDNDFPFSAIYLDQPFSRNFNLIQEILPSAERINIALGPDTFQYSDSINNEAKHRGIALNIAKIDSESVLIENLNKTLIDSDVMLGIIDPLVFSRTSARNILLTTYRWRVPLIGISPAYVNAGALAAIYSSPDQIGIQLASTIELLPLNKLTTLPPPQYPKQFKISINYRVAEAMGIQIIEENKLIERLEQLESNPLPKKTP